MSTATLVTAAMPTVAADHQPAPGTVRPDQIDGVHPIVEAAGQAPGSTDPPVG